MINVKNIKSIFSIMAENEESIMEKIDNVRFYNKNYEYYLMNIETKKDYVTDLKEEYVKQCVTTYKAWFAKVEKG